MPEPLRRPRRWHRWVVQGLVLAVLATLAAGAAIAAGLGEGLQRQVTDRWFPRGRVDDRLLVVAVDQRATEVPPGTGWGFVQHAELVTALDEAGAAKIVLHNDFERLPDSDLNDSPTLVRAMANADKVAVGIPPVALDPPERRRSRIPPIRARSPDLAGPYGAARGIGFTNVDPDPVDQVVRSVPLVVDAPDDDQLQPGLSLAILIETERLRPVSAAESGGGGILVAGRRHVPTDQAGGLRVSWAAGLTPGGAGIVGALDVLQGRVPAERIRGRTVVVGLTDPAFAERHRTPVGELPGVLVHANAANTMLTGAWVRPVPMVETLAWIFCLTALVGAAAAVLPLWLVPLPAVLTAWGYLGLAGLRVDGGRLMDVVRPVSAVLAAMLGTVLLRGAAEFRKRRQVQSLFGEYVPAGVVAQLLDEGRVEAATGGERLDVAVLFCDLRGFTTMAESLEPSQVRDVLNAYYRAITRIVFDHGGTVMQYVGDEVFSVFGAPIIQPEAAATALACALAMQQAAARLNDALAERGLPPVAYGIGLHRGEVVAAHLGNEIRRQYAVVGDPVNVGSRLCGQARAGEVVISDAILDRAGERLAVEPLGPLPLKGKREAVRAFRVTTGQPHAPEPVQRPQG